MPFADPSRTAMLTLSAVGSRQWSIAPAQSRSNQMRGGTEPRREAGGLAHSDGDQVEEMFTGERHCHRAKGRWPVTDQLLDVAGNIAAEKPAAGTCRFATRAMSRRSASASSGRRSIGSSERATSGTRASIRVRRLRLCSRPPPPANCTRRRLLAGSATDGHRREPRKPLANSGT